MIFAAVLVALPHIAAASPIGRRHICHFQIVPSVADHFPGSISRFRRQLLNTPGVSVGPATVAIAVGGYTDSVDGDDGFLDGSGSSGHSLWSNFASSLFAFDFSVAALGDLPTHVGLVWTDAGNVVTATTASPASLRGVRRERRDVGCDRPFVLGDGSISGQTVEDRFFGAVNSGGISRIEIRSPDTNDWEVDHLQYGRATEQALDVQAVPEPATSGLLLTGWGSSRGRCGAGQPSAGTATVEIRRAPDLLPSCLIFS
jgi:hypothetical protein